jgi:hypothetical protein
VSTTRTNPDPHTAPAVASTYGEDRWQGPSFAASWISPPRPRAALDDPTLPQREDDHA